MTPTNLIKALAEEIRQATAQIKLPTEYARNPSAENFTKINVFEQYLPADLFEQTSYYPLISVEWLKTFDKLSGREAGSTATVLLSFGVYAKEADGWQDAFHLMAVCRQRLLERRTVAQRYRLQDEVTWQAAENQPAPFFIVYGVLDYQLYLQQEEYYGESHLYWTQCRGRDDQSAFH